MNPSLIEEKIYRVLEKLYHLDRPKDEEKIANAMVDGGKSIGLYPRDFGMDAWDWPQGVSLYGMYQLYQSNRDASILEKITHWYEKHIDALPQKNINTTAPLLTLSYISKDLGLEYEQLCNHWVQWLIQDLPKTTDNGFQHTTTDNAQLGTILLNEGEIWLDTLFMCVLFTARMGITQQNEVYCNTALHQMLVHIKYLYEKKTGLFYHGYTFIHQTNFGGIYWCRGNSWFTASVVDFLEIMGSWLQTGTRDFLIDTYRAQVDALIKLQDVSGLWHTVLDDATSYLEVSGSAGICYGILKGVRLGLLDPSYRAYAKEGIVAILNNIDESGTVLNVSAGTSMGMNQDHYKNIMIAPMAYGQSLVIMALTEALYAF